MVNGWRGPLLGFTQSAMVTPVFFDAHSVIDRNNAPGRANVGASGSGKSRSLFTTSVFDVLLGRAVVMIEAKFDSGNIVRIPEVTHATRNLNTYFLREAPAGCLDPFSLYTPKEALTEVLNVVKSLLGREVFTVYEPTFMTTLSEYLSTRKEYSLLEYVHYLQQTQGRGSKGYELAVRLDGISQIEYANLLFDRSNGRSLSALSDLSQPGYTIVSLLGLELPKAKKPESEYSASERIGLTLLSLVLSRLYKSTMLDKRDKAFPVSIYIDEAWQILQTSSGLSTCEAFLRMARAHNVAMHFATQAPSDLKEIAQHISSWFVFRVQDGAIDRSTGKLEAEYAGQVLGISTIEASHVLGSLTVGKACFRDVDRRMSVMDFYCPERWAPYFETNPHKRQEFERQLRAMSQ